MCVFIEYYYYIIFLLLYTSFMAHIDIYVGGNYLNENVVSW